jgi:hypothetical protein
LFYLHTEVRAFQDRQRAVEFNPDVPKGHNGKPQIEMTGSGDTAALSYVSSILRNKSLKECLVFTSRACETRIERPLALRPVQQFRFRIIQSCALPSIVRLGRRWCFQSVI